MSLSHPFVHLSAQESRKSVPSSLSWPLQILQEYDRSFRLQVSFWQKAFKLIRCIRRSVRISPYRLTAKHRGLPCLLISLNSFLLSNLPTELWGRKGIYSLVKVRAGGRMLCFQMECITRECWKIPVADCQRENVHCWRVSRFLWVQSHDKGQVLLLVRWKRCRAFALSLQDNKNCLASRKFLYLTWLVELLWLICYWKIWI